MRLPIYQLYFGDIKLAEVITESSDFLDVCGSYRLTIDDRYSIKIQKILKYITYSIASCDEELDYNRKQIDFNAEHDELQFLNFIESDEWWLQDEKGDRQDIQVPIFSGDNEIHWRWNHEHSLTR